MIELDEAGRLVDRIAGPLLDDHFMWGAMRHSLIDNVLCGMRLETTEDVLAWLGKTGIRALEVSRR